MQSTEDKEAQPLSNSALSKDFSRVPISTTKPQQIMTKLMIGAVGDKYEQEADRVAAQVVQRINAPAFVQSGEDETVQREKMETIDNEARLMRSSILQRRSSDGGMAATPDLEASINRAKGAGRPMADKIRQPMEKAFGADFSGVKVHTDSRADQLNQSIQAKAFTTGQDVFFRQGAYEPGSGGGQELLAHELTHVAQQSRRTLHRQKIQSKSNGSIASTVLKKNGATVQTVASSQANDSPNRVGIEQELTSVTLTLKSENQETDEQSGVKLAETNEKTFGGLPVFRLETEGADRGTLCIELIHGPLEMKEYNTQIYIAAKKELLSQLSKQGPLNEALNEYNTKIKNNRYKLEITNDAARYKISKPQKTSNINTQTNVAIPYSKLGQIPQEGEQGFEEMFGPKEISDQKVYKKARDEAQKIKEKMGKLQDDRHIQSLLTHIIYQEAKFIYHDIDKKNIKKDQKHHFHVMLKLSPEDAVVSILSDQETYELEKWLRKEDKDIKESIKKAFDTFNSPRQLQNQKLNSNANSIKEQLQKAIKTRQKGAKKLKKVNTDTEESKALDESDNEIKDKENNDITVRHTHPRPTNRIAVYSHDGEHYIVVEQRSSKHLLNEGDVSDNFDKKSKFIAEQQKVVKVSKPEGKVKKPSSKSSKLKSGSKPSSLLTTTTAKKDENGLYINETKGDGNCFFHAVYEAMYNMRSTATDQSMIRQTVIHQLLENPNMLQDVLGQVPNDNTVSTTINSLQDGLWTQNTTPGLVATALGLTIVVHNPDGSIYTTIVPQNRSSHETIHITYTGNHFNSHSRDPLPSPAQD
ncbi:DUF4157 domain-containing protein [Nostocaceae cyanobacterium CENA369]|uniref:DUF4157 domain-containing protein n=1 Tax=Dendronalium phyllosphericum CENA369 TaxID=1725256 RepID=A0A8J7LHJ5_9NOST|nr:DUF4157 domain-containing protein [Dendronalium phyllosphericum]MBH8578152.1 DUF4157 domain-containing protein [Dendronalium phyllosphericum CENA369]